jgi:hypothetical protein
VVAEAVRSTEFATAYERLPEQKKFEVTWAVDIIEQDPAWGAVDGRYLAPADSPFSGFIIDFTVEGYGIVYRIEDHGAVVELWYLFEIPTPPRAARARRPGPVPLM